MQIRFTKPILDYGTVQLMCGQVLDVSEELALGFVEREEASLVPFAEQTTMPRPPQTATMPRPTVTKPKPPSNARKPR